MIKVCKTYESHVCDADDNRQHVEYDTVVHVQVT